MLKLLGWMVLLAATFGAGYYVGQHPIGELRKTVGELSRSLRDTTLGIERTIRLRQGLVDGKAGVVEAKSELLDKNFGNAANALAQAVENLEKASSVERERDAGGAQKVRPLLAKVREAQLELSMGKPLPRAKLDEIQKELDGLLAQ
ncbi:MAG: hypothetical protein AB1411_00625 [Nitrospirota bacterium]|jgi:hypothetical protein